MHIVSQTSSRESNGEVSCVALFNLLSWNNVSHSPFPCMAPGYYWAKNTFKQDLEGESEAAASHVYPRKGQRWVTHVGADLLAHLRTTQGHNSSSNYQILFQLLWVPSQMCIQLHSKSHWLYHIGHLNIETGGDERQLWVPVWVPVLPPV